MGEGARGGVNSHRGRDRRWLPLVEDTTRNRLNRKSDLPQGREADEHATEPANETVATDAIYLQLVPNMQLGHVEFPLPGRRDPPVARGAHPAQDRLEEVGRRVQRAPGSIRELSLARPHHPGWGPGQGVLELPHPTRSGRRV